MAYLRRGNVYGARTYPYRDRHHKRMGFRPHEQLYHKSKSEIHKYLLQKKVNGVPLAHLVHYRIYHHKYRGWTLYVGPEKISHGGLRTKPTQTRYITKTMMKHGVPKARAQAVAAYWVRMKKMKKKGQYGPISASELKQLESLEKQYREEPKKEDYTKDELQSPKVKSQKQRDESHWKELTNIYGKEKAGEIRAQYEIIQEQRKEKGQKYNEKENAKKEREYEIILPNAEVGDEQEYKHREEKKGNANVGNPYLHQKKKTHQAEFRFKRGDASKYPKAFEGLPGASHGGGMFRDVDTNEIISWHKVQAWQQKIGKSKVKVNYYTHIPVSSTLAYKGNRPFYDTRTPSAKANVKQWLPKGLPKFQGHKLKYETMNPGGSKAIFREWDRKRKK